MLYPRIMDPVLPALVAERFGMPETVIFDVGCSEGAAMEWRSLSPRVFGFDPLVAEIARLRAADPESIFVEGFVGGPVGDNPVDSWFGKASFWVANAILHRDHVKEVHNAGAEVVYSEHHFTLDDFVREQGVSPHILKTDTDGNDYAVLRGAGQALKTVVVAHVEAAFQAYAPDKTVFRDVDAYMVSQGFVLIDMSLARYTRASLPGRFIGTLVASTQTGGIAWCDALYIREPDSLEGEDLLRLAMAAELTHLPDIAAEALIRHGNAEPLLDALVRYSPFPELQSYEALMAKFANDPRTFDE